ncbi:proline iminopeptidase-family hydrolase [Streptomyces griseorubiginosus]|uniref:proline iminopeptidase-family hydrolase n=1 Tax=Streptomyces griseorubiginosus TaxID=67304 RepID=UPI002E819AA7|nr:proline iminopeptidase-family hydrolase [Streptomyces griseorubiginosus]WUB49013.1 proline iminopeptidase-family hydrolase [Streptomyces griseorubiginosus]WUB57540.1 proline iminopeptidase-family hydrolase [Streptomyces griseorubiginosus]
MAIPEPHHTGTVDFHGHSTWYRITGEPGRTPLVVLHGGPGAGHHYTLSIAGISEQGRPVIHYDQLGTGYSTHLPDRGADFWTVQLFLDELDNLLEALGIADGYHILGQSWGGMLAAEHAVRRPAGLRGLVIANSPASMGLWLEAAAELRAGLPEEVQHTLHAHEAAGTTDHPDYRAAEQVFNERHVCRLTPNPPEVQATWDNIAADPTVYHTMNGPNEFHVVGTLKDWSVIDRLHLIEVPTLLVSGRFDEATPETVRPFADHIPDVRWHMFEHSSHMPHVEEEELYLRIVGEFLDSTD